MNREQYIRKDFRLVAKATTSNKLFVWFWLDDDDASDEYIGGKQY
jgi:hypothetical protein